LLGINKIYKFGNAIIKNYLKKINLIINMSTTIANADDQLTNLPGFGAVEGIQFAGYASVRGVTGNNGAEKADENLFYWFAGQKNYAETPTIIWSNGGPGSSSFWGFFLENGPYDITGTKENPVISARKDGWNNYANYVMFEQPLSVTVSFANHAEDIPQTPEMGTAQYYQALLNFIAKHPEIEKNPIILAGESYAGTYLPLLAQAILDGNAKGYSKIKLAGVVLLDAWVDPVTQMEQDTNYALTHGLINAAEKAELDAKYTGLDPTTGLPAINAAIEAICQCYMANIEEAGDPDIDPVITYLNNPDVRKALHITSALPVEQAWSKEVSDNYTPYVNNSYLGTVENLLNAGIPVMVVSGLNDAKDCNFMGTGEWLAKLTSPAAKPFAAAKTTPWKDTKTSQVLGFMQDGGQLSWLKVLSAGHLAVLDQPKIINVILDKLGK
jgi:vitellogenic carboxypeptidase-like protein